LGTAAGLAAALMTGHLIEKLLFGVKAKDPVIYTAVVLGIAAVGLLANWIPARRAAAVDPMRALRTE
jgi:ABC-type antimicrobial peptide transport system permease subunit